MSSNLTEKSFPASVQFPSGKKIRYKTIAEDFTELNRFFFEYLTSFSIPVAFKEKFAENVLSMHEHLPYTFYLKVSNNLDTAAANTFGKNLWEPFPMPVIEYVHFGNGENIISQNHIVSLDIALIEDLKYMNRACTKINAVMKSFFERRNFSLVSFGCFFGKSENKVVLCGDFAPPYLQVIQTPELSSVEQNYFNFDDAAQLKNYVNLLLNAIKS